MHRLWCLGVRVCNLYCSAYPASNWTIYVEGISRSLKLALYFGGHVPEPLHRTWCVAAFSALSVSAYQVPGLIPSGARLFIF